MRERSFESSRVTHQTEPMAWAAKQQTEEWLVAEPEQGFEETK